MMELQRYPVFVDKKSDNNGLVDVDVVIQPPGCNIIRLHEIVGVEKFDPPYKCEVGAKFSYIGRRASDMGVSWGPTIAIYTVER